MISSLSYSQNGSNNVIVKLDEDMESELTFEIDFKNVSVIDVNVVLLNRICEELISKNNIPLENINLGMVEKHREHVNLYKEFTLIEHNFFKPNPSEKHQELGTKIFSQIAEIKKELDYNHQFLSQLTMENVVFHGLNKRLGPDCLTMARKEAYDHLMKREGKDIDIKLTPELDKLIINFDALMQNKKNIVDATAFKLINGLSYPTLFL